MRRIDRILIVLAMILFGHAMVDAIRARFFLDVPMPRRPVPTAPGPDLSREAEPFARRLAPDVVLLPGPGERDAVLTVAASQARKHGQRSIGTAFAVGRGGYWLTARHVIDGCATVALRRGNQADKATVAYVHSGADIAVLRAGGGGPPLPVTAGPLARGEDGYAYGIAGQGGPSAIHGALIGRARAVMSGRMTGITNVTVWAERAIVPPGERWIGGMSGGPLLVGEGAVAGVMSVASQRRGRIFTVAPETIAEAMRGAGIGFNPATAAPVASTPATMERLRDLMLERRTVAQVLCTA